MGEKFAKLSESQQAICARFKLAREDAGVTQDKIGLHVGLSRDQVASIEAARVPLRFWHGWRFCVELDVNAEWLAQGEEPMRPCVDYFKTYTIPPDLNDNDELTFEAGFLEIEYHYKPLFREAAHGKRRVGGLRGELSRRVHTGGSAHKQALTALFNDWLHDVGPDNRDSLIAHVCSAVRDFKLSLKKK